MNNVCQLTTSNCIMLSTDKLQYDITHALVRTN